MLSGDITIAPVPVRARRKITGMSAVLLPFLEDDSVDWTSFDEHVERTLRGGLAPAINMDTGYANLIDEATRVEVLQRTQAICDGRMFVSGVYVSDKQSAAFDLTAYCRGIDEIQQHDGVPVIFQSWGLTEQSDDAIVASYRQIGERCDRFVAFELGSIFLPFGKIYSLDVYRELMNISNCIGAKHSSLKRQPEWERLQLRDAVRPDFMVLTGNDWAVDMVMYGSDYLLGLSSFCPEAFGRRDAMWEAGDPAFYELNDVLQYLGFFAFRPPVPAYKHTCAQFLNLAGQISTDRTHPQAPTRPQSDRETLRSIVEMLQEYM